MYARNLSHAFNQKWGNVQVSAFAPLLSDEDILQACRDLGHAWRQSPFPPPAVVRSQLFRALHPDQSIANTIEHLVAEDSLKRPISPSAWSQARSRGPQELLPILIRQTAARAMKKFPCRWHGREVFLVDGTTITMPDEPELAQRFGTTDSKHGRSRFPVGRVLALLHAGARVIPEYRLAPYQTSEIEMFLEILPRIPPHSLCVADRYFSGFPALALSLRRGLDFVTPLHHRRSAKRLIRAGKRRGPDEWRVTLHTSDAMRTKYAHWDLPETMEVRLIRYRYTHGKQRKTLWLITSLLDRQAYPREDIIGLYGERWGIETHYAYLKVTLRMAVLRSKTATHIDREMAAIVLVHNLLWHLIGCAAQEAGVPPNRISFARTVKSVLAFCPRLSSAPPGKRQHIYQQLLQRIGNHLNPHRPGRHEPRLVKRQRKRYGALRVPREQARHAA